MGLCYGPLATIIWVLLGTYADYVATTYWRYDRGRSRQLICQKFFGMPWWSLSGTVAVGVILFFVFLGLGLIDPIFSGIMLIIGAIVMGIILLVDSIHLQQMPIQPCDHLPMPYQSVVNTIHYLPVPQQVRSIDVPSLYVIDGISAGRIYYLAAQQMDIGRSRNNSIPIKDMSISRQHARIIQQQGRWIIRDLGSSAGIMVNGRRVKSKTLVNNDIIKLGNISMEFRLPASKR